MKAVLIAGLAAVLTAAAGPLAASEPLPADTVPSTGAPPLVPDGGRERLTDWVAACVASGRRQVGTRAGGDLLYSAGVVLARELAQPTRALDVLGEAAAAYPADAPYRGLVLLTAAELHLTGGDAVAARRLLDAAEAAAARPVPADADVVTSSRHDVLTEHMTLLASRLGVRIDEASGDLASAAARQEAIAQALDRQGAPRATRAWSAAARLHARSGNEARALAAVDRALEIVEHDEARADLAFWRLHLRYGLLDAEGAPTLGAHWPGDAFVDDAQVALRGLAGNPYVGPWLLALASRAVTAGHAEAALDLYLLALRDPVLMDRARDDSMLSGGLLVAFPVALRLGRLDEAQRILDVVGGGSGMSRAELDPLQLALARARVRAARTEPPAAPQPEAEQETEAEAEAPPSPHRGRLYPHGPPDPEADVSRAPPDGEEEAGPASGTRGLLGAACGVTALALFLLVARRRRRRRDSLGGHPPRR